MALTAIIRWSCFGVSCSLALLIADAVASTVLSAADSCCWLIAAIVYGTSRPSMFTVLFVAGSVAAAMCYCCLQNWGSHLHFKYLVLRARTLHLLRQYRVQHLCLEYPTDRAHPRPPSQPGCCAHTNTDSSSVDRQTQRREQTSV